jgi:iron(III) transport system ATP-binding protein
MIELRGIRKTLGGKPVLEEVDLAVQPGECVVITGDSGSGKTTLLRIVAGLETPDSGSVRLRGHDATTKPPHVRALGFQFQDAALWPHMTLLDNVSFSGPEAAARAGEFLERAGLAHLAKRKPAEISGGEARRAALARTLAPRRDIVLLDEPLSNLQAALRAQMAQWIGEELRMSKAACLWVAHDAVEAAGVASRVLTLASGRLTSAAAKR